MAQRSRKRRQHRRAQAQARRPDDAAPADEAPSDQDAPPTRGPARSSARDRSDAAERAAARRAARRRTADPDRRPEPPWAPFPLVELLVLAGIILLVAGFAVRGHRGTIMIGAGLALATIGGLELSVREHFTGYRSHTALLAGAAAIIVLVGLSLLAPGLPLIVALLLALVAFGASARFLVRTFQRRSGLSFKFR